MNMKVFLINLDKDVDRLAAFDEQAKRLGVEYERVSAVYAKDEIQSGRLKVAEVESRFRCWCAVGQTLTPGEIGCALSHQLVYRRMLEKGIDLACVLEDDVVLDERFPKVLAEVERWYDRTRSSVVLLSNHSESGGQLGDGVTGFLSPSGQTETQIKSSAGDYFAEGYVLGSVAATALLRENSPLIVPADHWPRWVRHGAIELCHAFPTVCSQNKTTFASATRPTAEKSVRERGIAYWIFRKSYRTVGVLLDRILRLITGR